MEKFLLKVRVKKKYLILLICHPSMANNELSGPCLSIYLSNWLRSKKLRYSYRFLFYQKQLVP